MCLKITEKEPQVLANANVVSSFTDQNNTEYVTFQYQPDELYNCEGQSYDLGESTLTYEIPVVHQEFGDNSTNTTTFVELQVVQEKEAIKTGIILLIDPVVRVVRSCNICEIKKGLWGTGPIACQPPVASVHGQPFGFLTKNVLWHLRFTTPLHKFCLVSGAV